jgi:hypothetical protein
MSDHRDNIMTALLDHLNELDRLWGTARRGTQSENFVSELRDAMQQVWSLSARKTNPDFVNADSALTEAIAAYENHPQVGVGKIGNALVRYRTTATS